MGDLSFINDESINRNIILVGLNISGKGNLEKPFSNFHPDYSTAHDYKIRYALENTIFWGSYMTDVIKDYEEVISNKVMKYLNNNPKFEKENIISFEKELEYIGANKPIIISFGNDSYKILKRNLGEKYHIYITSDGRINVAGINVKNIDYLVESIVKVIKY